MNLFRKRLLYPKFGLAKVLGESLSIKRKERNKRLLAQQIDFMQYSDGKNNLETISKFIKLPLSETKKIFYLLRKLKMIKTLN